MKTEVITTENGAQFKFTPDKGNEIYYVPVENNSILEANEETLFKLLRQKQIFEQFILRIVYSEGKYIIVFEKGENG